MHWPFPDFLLNFPPVMNKMNKEKTGKMCPVSPVITTFTIMESHLHMNQNPYRFDSNAATLLETKPAKRRMSNKHLSFVVEWQMYNHLSGTTSEEK
jgi:hypothetical protein